MIPTADQTAYGELLAFMDDEKNMGLMCPVCNLSALPHSDPGGCRDYIARFTQTRPCKNCNFPATTSQLFDGMCTRCRNSKGQSEPRGIDWDLRIGPGGGGIT